jgi:hypothetical protein
VSLEAKAVESHHTNDDGNTDDNPNEADSAFLHLYFFSIYTTYLSDFYLLLSTGVGFVR